VSESAKQDLSDIGVEVRLGAKVNMIDADGVQINGEHIPAKSVFWAAGVQAASLEFSPPVQKDPAGRVYVSADFSIAHYPEVFVVGDMAHYELNHTSGKSAILPGLAPVAIQSGKFVANRILEQVRGEKPSQFKYFDKGQMATIGKRRAIAETGKFRIRGFIAWIAWLFVHVFYLIGFKNRIAVMTLWAWSYIFSKRGARLITGNLTTV
jgi:NADH dehydrogenase